MRHPLLPVLAACCALLSPAAHADATDAMDAAMNRIIGKLASEQNLSLVFGLLRQSLAAASEDKAAPEVSAETTARLEATAKEAQREIAAASVLMLDVIEKEARESLRAEFGR